jgi:hypothetical protein
MQLRTVNNYFKAAARPLELFKSKGYFYFVYDDGARYEMYSIMTMRLNNLKLVQWLQIGNDFADAVENSSFGYNSSF